MLQYFAVNFFSPILVSGHLDQNNVLKIYVASDHASVYQTVFVRYYKWGTVTPVSSFNVVANLVSTYVKENIISIINCHLNPKERIDIYITIFVSGSGWTASRFMSCLTFWFPFWSHFLERILVVILRGLNLPTTWIGLRTGTNFSWFYRNRKGRVTRAFIVVSVDIVSMFLKSVTHLVSVWCL